MDFFELEAFTALAATLHFAKAAAQVNTSPSALSRLLARLEQETGACLIERDTRGARLTEAGESFLEFALETLRRRDRVQFLITSSHHELRGTLRIFASVTACYSILPPLVEAIGKRFPTVKLSVETGDPADASAALFAGRVDVALAALPEEGFKGHDAFLVRSSPLVFVASSRFDSLKNLEQLAAGGTFILPSRGLARERFDNWARHHRLRPEVAAEVAGNEAILALTRLGLGVGLVPGIVLENSPFSEGLRIIDAGIEFGGYDIGYVVKSQTAIASVLSSLLPEVYAAGVWR